MKKRSIALLALVLILTVAISGTAAWLVTHTGPVTNTFTPASVSTEIDETIENGVKKEVAIKNDSDIPVYLRATVVLNYVDGSGNILPGTPAVPTHEAGWTEGTDGYYYSTSAVAAGASLPLFTNVSADAGVRMTILTEAIQANPIDAVNNAWPDHPAFSN